jgi:WD40 repeat protein
MTLEGHSAAVVAMAVSRDGILATASADHTARLWHLASGDLLAVLQGHGAPLKAVNFSADGTALVTAAADRVAIVWDTSQERRTPAEIAKIVSRRSPWRLEGSRLRPNPKR